MSEADYKYDVAISFLSGDLDVGQKLADLLRDRMNVFLFTERQSEVAGADGIELLSSVFGEQARIAVVLYREGWGKTARTGIEETAIKNRGLEQGWDFVLMIPLEANPTVPKWLPRAQIWLSYERYGLPTAVAVIERKLEETGGRSETHYGSKPRERASSSRRMARRTGSQTWNAGGSGRRKRARQGEQSDPHIRFRRLLYNSVRLHNLPRYRRMQCHLPTFEPSAVPRDSPRSSDFHGGTHNIG